MTEFSASEVFHAFLSLIYLTAPHYRNCSIAYYQTSSPVRVMSSFLILSSISQPDPSVSCHLHYYDYCDLGSSYCSSSPHITLIYSAILWCPIRRITCLFTDSSWILFIIYCIYNTVNFWFYLNFRMTDFIMNWFLSFCIYIYS